MTPISQGLTRVSVRRGFYALRLGQFGVCNPGDIVDVNTNDAKMLRAADKVDFVDQNTDPKFDPKYVKPAVPAVISSEEKQLAALTDAVQALTELVKTLVKDPKGTKST